MQFIMRDISVAKETINDIIMREITQTRELKRFNVSDYKRAQVEESLGKTKKTRCGCCLQKFLYINLPLKVSQKAILDIREKWTGGLNSETIFGGKSTVGTAESGTVGKDVPSSTVSSSAGFSAWAEDFKKAERLKVVPRCYDEVNVCLFCAQFFQVQEEYRPAYSTIVQEERRKGHSEERRREQEYWDPLKMCELWKDSTSNEGRGVGNALDAAQRVDEGGAGGGVTDGSLADGSSTI